MLIELKAWAFRNDISDVAYNELIELFGMSSVSITSPSDGSDSESSVQNKVRIQASKLGMTLWRNNVGVFTDKRGIPVRYGLANESKRMNSVIKSSDLIGVRPVTIDESHVGTIIGQFVALEVKKESWVFSNRPHEVAQLNFLKLMGSRGAYAKFINNASQLM